MDKHEILAFMQFFFKFELCKSWFQEAWHEKVAKMIVNSEPSPL